MSQTGAIPPRLSMIPVPGGDEGLRAALSAQGLPVDDLLEPGRLFFRFAGDGGVTIGYGGLELGFDGVGLLRSLVVHRDRRNRGHGSAIVDALLAEARRRGMRRIFLLTSTTGDFFARVGFAEMSRMALPPAVVQSRQFSTLCPASALVMERVLDSLGQAAE